MAQFDEAACKKASMEVRVLLRAKYKAVDSLVRSLLEGNVLNGFCYEVRCDRWSGHAWYLVEATPEDFEEIRRRLDVHIGRKVQGSWKCHRPIIESWRVSVYYAGDSRHLQVRAWRP